MVLITYTFQHMNTIRAILYIHSKGRATDNEIRKLLRTKYNGKLSLLLALAHCKEWFIGRVIKDDVDYWEEKKDVDGIELVSYEEVDGIPIWEFNIRLFRIKEYKLDLKNPYLTVEIDTAKLARVETIKCK